MPYILVTLLRFGGTCIILIYCVGLIYNLQNNVVFETYLEYKIAVQGEVPTSTANILSVFVPGVIHFTEQGRRVNLN